MELVNRKWKMDYAICRCFTVPPHSFPVLRSQFSVHQFILSEDEMHACRVLPRYSLATARSIFSRAFSMFSTELA